MLDGVVDKVAARLTLDISPAQKAMLQMSDEYQQMNQRMLKSDASGSDALLQSQTQIGETRRRLSYSQQEKLNQIRLEGEARRQTIQKESDAKIEITMQRNFAKMLQDEEMFQQRMNQMRSGGSGGSSGSSGYTIGKHIAADLTVFAILDQLTKIPHVIGDISAGMTKLKQVLELSDQLKGVEQLNDALQQLQGVAEQQAVLYGKDVSVVLDVMTQAGRRFKDIPSIIVATDNALQAMRADNVDAEKAIKGEEAMMAQFNLTLSETRDAWAKMTVASHVFLTDATGIIDAVERSGSSFHGMKVNTEGAIATIVALAQESGRTGAVVGNTWKSIENTLGTKKGVEALHELGIEAEIANGQLVDGVTILGKLQEKWPELSESSRNAFASILAGGKYQYNQLLTFLNDTSGTYVKALSEMKKATYETQQALVKSAMESLPAQAQMTSASLQVMANSFSNVVTPAMMEFFGLLRKGASWVGEHANSIEHLIGMGMKLGEAYVAWRVGLVLYNAAVDTSIVKNTLLEASFARFIFRSGGVVQGLAAITTTMYGVGSAAVATAAKIGALLAVVSEFNSIAARGTDPLGAKEKDIQSQIDTLEKLKEGNLSGTVLQRLNYVNPFGGEFDVQRFIESGGAVRESLSSPIDEQIQELKKDLWNVQSQRLQQQQGEYDSYQKMVNDMLEQAKKAGSIHPDLPNGPDTTMPGGSSGGGASSFVEPFKDMTSGYKSQLDPFAQAVSSSSASIRMLDAQLQGLNASTRDGILTQSQMNELQSKEDQKIQELTSHQQLLHLEHEAIKAMLPILAAQMEEVNRQYDAGTISAEEHRQAIDNLRSEYDSMTLKMNDNSVQWWDDATKIAEAEDKVTEALKKQTDAIEEKLKAGYESEKQYQEQKLEDRYKQDTKVIQDQVTALEDQKKAIDEVIASLQEQWKQQDDNNKLAELQDQLEKVKADKRFDIVGLNGQLTRTYDVAKATELEKQIADEQVRIAHDAQIKQYEDQKTGIDKQIGALNLQLQAVKDTYDKQKQDLDNYWNYRMQQDQLKAEADRMILKTGYDKALVDAQSFANKMNSIMASIHAPGVSAGGAVSAGLGQINPGSSYGSSGHEYGMSDDDYRQFRQNSEDWFHSSTEDQQKLGAANDAMRDKYGIPQGVIPKLKLGGKVPNIGSGGTDSVLSLLTPGEIVAPSFEDLMKSFAPKIVQMDSGSGQVVQIQRLELNVQTDSGEKVMRELEHEIWKMKA